MIFISKTSKWLSNFFEKDSGLNINLVKSKFCSINVANPCAIEVAQEWNISCCDLPLSYLEVPLGDNSNSSKAFRINIEDKINKKLSNWKYSHMFKGGKLTLINYR